MLLVMRSTLIAASAAISLVLMHEVNDLLAGLVDRIRSERRTRLHTEIDAQKLLVLKETMRTVQDIVNNSLNGMELFRMEAQGAVSEQSLESLDKLIEETSGKLKALADLDSVHEKQMAVGVGIDYPWHSFAETQPHLAQ